MKKIFALMLALIILLSLASCSSNQGADSENTANDSNNQTEQSAIGTEEHDIGTEVPKNEGEEATEPAVSDAPAETSPHVHETASNDKTAPVVESFAVDKKSVKVGDMVTVTMKITDESEITSCRVVFNMSNGQSGNAWTDLKKGADGLFRGIIAIDSTFVSGKCTLNWFQVDDKYSNSLLVCEGYNDVFFEVEGASADMTAPVVESFTVDKNHAKIGDFITITMKITDESEITSCRVVFNMSNGQSGNAWTDLKKGADGLFRGIITIDSTFVAGKCTLDWFQVDDVFSNSLLVSEGYEDVFFVVE